MPVAVDLNQVIFDVLSPLLGKFTAQKAVEIACQRIKKTPAELTIADLPEVLAGLRPMLRTLLGEHLAARVLEDIERRGGGAA
ncbi:MAG TPA: hypothetical protein PK668_08420 [Myxococcota bacterium]|nr:hypothetical protein [Myxococcota bacterium]HRY92999.1 hypothetical protein [Myxococcota bacterium]HSA21309.1 hypothetical protein [Myxococcota bacterium]